MKRLLAVSVLAAAVAVAEQPVQRRLLGRGVHRELEVGRPFWPSARGRPPFAAEAPAAGGEDRPRGREYAHSTTTSIFFCPSRLIEILK